MSGLEYFRMKWCVMMCISLQSSDPSVSCLYFFLQMAFSCLRSDLGSMVNNPQLSDVQLQVDTGEVYFAHSFMLYARCPLLVEMVNNITMVFKPFSNVTNKLAAKKCHRT